MVTKDVVRKVLSMLAMMPKLCRSRETINQKLCFSPTNIKKNFSAPASCCGATYPNCPTTPLHPWYGTVMTHHARPSRNNFSFRIIITVLVLPHSHSHLISSHKANTPAPNTTHRQQQHLLFSSLCSHHRSHNLR